MAEFTPKKIVLGDINNGIEFTESDGVTPNAINDPIEAVAYAQTVVEHLTDTPDTSEINGAGSPNVSFVSSTTADGVTIHKFKFSNLSGATFTPSLDEAGNLSWSNNRNLTNPPTINISGRDYLFSSEVLSGTYIPQVNSEVTDMPLTSFNRAPVDDIDHCYLFYYYTPENIYYWLATQVVDIQETTATLKILSVVRLTGYTPTIGENGNWVINGEDTGKPSYGASGVTDVVAGASYNQNDFTITPLTFNFEVGNSKTVNVKAAVGNVEDGSYAKLAQVVRVDTAQSLTDTQKQRAQRNVTVVASTQQIYGQTITAGWYEIAKIAQATCGKIIWAQGSGSGYPAEWKIDVSIGIPWDSDDINAILSFEGMGVTPSYNIPRRARLRRIGSDYYFDVYLEQTNSLNAVYCVFDMYSGSPNPVEITPLTNGMFPNRGVADEPSDSVTLIIDIYKNGINTTGQVYQQGSPVLVGDQSAIFESDGVTVKKATKATQDADGNVINATYAKLSQVVRVDATQQLTDDQKWTFSKNSRFILQKTIERASQWKTVARIDGYGQVCMAVSTDLPGQGQLEVKFFLAIGYMNAANITQVGYTDNSPVSAIRLRSTANAQTYIDLLFNEITAVDTAVSVYFEANLNSKYTSTDIKLLDFVDFSGDESDYTITTLNLNNSGINTMGTIYQQGSPVLVGFDSPKLSGTSGTVKLPSKGWYCINYKATLLAQWYSTGVFYWDGGATYLPVSAYLVLGSTVTKRAVNISNGGTVSVFDPDTGSSYTDFTVTYYKLA